MRRFGWSDSSQSEAQENAERRTQEALQRLVSGEKLPRREPKIPYNGADGVPIREEIVARHGDTIVTRNTYGARCLNTPNVLFADIDFQYEPGMRLTFTIFALVAVCATAAQLLLHSGVLTAAVAILGAIFSSTVAALLHRALQRAKGGFEHAARARIARFLARHPEWNLRLYRTPAGMRVLVTHRTFAPGEPAVAECFSALDTDPLYSRMCLNQQCFRARVSPKPWRIGIGEHMRPRPGVWPVAAERMPLRNAWIAKYEAAAKSFAACRLLGSVGSGVVHPEVRAVQELHDELCQANGQLPIA